MSKDEFRTAFDKIGIRYKSKSEFDQSVDKYQGRFYCSYVDRRSNLTYYFRNHELVDAALDELLSKPVQKQEKLNTPSTPNPHADGKFTVKRESRFTGNQESRFTGSWDSQSTGNEDSRHTVNRENPPPLYRDYNTETTTTTSDSIAIDPGGCGEDLIFPKCTENESIAISQLLADCPVYMRQVALDEIEGARQAGVIKTNLVPFARGIMMAIARGTFTVGHGPKVADQRARQTNQPDQSNLDALPLDPEALTKGKAFMSRIGSMRSDRTFT